MDPVTASLVLSGGLGILGMANQNAQKKQQMLAAAEQTRYAPWTGQSGNGAFNDAMKIDPFGGMLKNVAGAGAGAMAQQSSDQKYDKMLSAITGASQAPSTGSASQVAASSPIGGYAQKLQPNADFDSMMKMQLAQQNN